MIKTDNFEQIPFLSLFRILLGNKFNKYEFIESEYQGIYEIHHFSNRDLKYVDIKLIQMRKTNPNMSLSITKLDYWMIVQPTNHL